MVHVGVGWAMARLPRFRWASIAPTDPLLRWLALDGYGFHQAYFRTQRYVREQYRDPSFRWPGDETRRYAGHAVDQGIGRALWFIGGTDPAVVSDLVDSFAADRRADLYSGSAWPPATPAVPPRPSCCTCSNGPATTGRNSPRASPSPRPPGWSPDC